MPLWLNSRRKQGLPDAADIAAGSISSDVAAVFRLLQRCPMAQKTPLTTVPELATRFEVDKLWVKDERSRMNLGSFKALGAVYAIAKEALATQKQELTTALTGVTYCCASAGNHGLSVAAGARLFGAQAVIYLAQTVPEDFARRLGEKGAKVVRGGRNYEESMEMAKEDATTHRWTLLSDTSWPGYTQLPRDIMEGYLATGAEVAEQILEPPTHVFLQAGVGGLAAACTATARKFWGETPKIIVVEPLFAPALYQSVQAGRVLTVTGAVSNMGRLDCKRPSDLALSFLAKEADAFQLINDEETASFIAELRAYGLATSPSGGAGLSAFANLNRAQRAHLGINEHSRILTYLSEGV